MNLNMPRWGWIILWVVVILVVLVILKFNFSIGSSGVHITQGLVR